ncbi:hypothetical protein DdX_00665 [Ditylenchus destructor]|uniref:CSD domain-containing protein n=1 Tax=Ditylenchus destructor TaxID=166010 RepID=A0AAD4R7G3_9BILA|nr:hypothetical protein DdX_00665 [Ditylenchus destructor]
MLFAFYVAVLLYSHDPLQSETLAIMGEENIGLVTNSNKNELEFWIKGNKRKSISIADISLEFCPKIGDMIRISNDEENHFHVAPINVKSMSDLVVRNECIEMPIHFLTTQQYLHPRSAVDKNFINAWCPELGFVPIVFANKFLPFHFYHGVAEISLKKTSTEDKIESRYNTPWLIRKDEYQLSNESYVNQFEQVGLIVEESDSQFVVLCKSTGPVLIKKKDAGHLKVTDWIRFTVIDIHEKQHNQTIIVGNKHPERITPVFETDIDEAQNIYVLHNITVLDTSFQKGVYNVDIIGNVADPKGLITNNMKNRTIFVKSKYWITQNDVRFSISKIVDGTSFPSNDKPKFRPINDTEKEKTSFLAGILEENFCKTASRGNPAKQRPIQPPKKRTTNANDVKSEGIVIATAGNSFRVYSSDTAIKNNIVELTSELLWPMPKLGDSVELISRNYNGINNPKYQHVGVRKMETSSYTVRIVKGTIQIRTIANIINQATIFAAKLGHIYNGDQRLPLSIKDEGKSVELWCTKIGRKGYHWGVAQNCEAKWLSSISELESLPKAIEQPTTAPYRFIGMRYRNKNSDEVSPSSSQKNSPASSLNGDAPRTNRNWDNRVRHHSDGCSTISREGRLQNANGNITQELSMKGIVTFKTRYGFYVYSNKYPTEEVFLPLKLVHGELQQGQWIRFSAKFVSREYTIDAYAKIPPEAPTMVAGNLVEVTVGAFVPTNFREMPKELKVVHSGLIPTIADDRGLVKDGMINKSIVVVATRANKPAVDLPWQISAILGSE